MKAIIVDDEPKAIELLKSYLQHFNGIELMATFRNGLKAFEYLSKEPTDIVFLDINMPHISGISLSKMIGKTTRVIFTTAHSDYAVESYEVQAVDYLLKPISLERFTNTVSKLLSQPVKEVAEKNNTIQVKSGSRTHLLKADDILFLEKDGNYITYHTLSAKILSRASISEALHSLPDHFTQVQRSYIVNTYKISSIDSEAIHIGQNIIPIGASFKDSLHKKLKFS